MSSDAPKDGGPAFPSEPKRFVVGNDGQPHPMPNHHSGMSLRDWFAGNAAAALADDYQLRAENLAHRAYEIADALLASREAKP